MKEFFFSIVIKIYLKGFFLFPEHGESTEDARRTDHERLVSGSLATDGEGKDQIPINHILVLRSRAKVLTGPLRNLGCDLVKGSVN